MSRDNQIQFESASLILGEGLQHFGRLLNLIAWWFDSRFVSQDIYAWRSGLEPLPHLTHNQYQRQYKERQ
jgi:hypothetical protein